MKMSVERWRDDVEQGKEKMNIKRVSPYRAVNTPRLGYKNQSVKLLGPEFFLILAHPVYKM